jgi:hypothetical protein
VVALYTLAPEQASRVQCLTDQFIEGPRVCNA